LLRRTIQNNKSWNPKQSVLIDKFISKENIKTGIIHEEFPVGIKRAHKFINPGVGHDYSINEKLREKNYEFRNFKSDIEMINGLKNHELNGDSISNAFGFLTSDSLQYVDAIFAEGKDIWVIEVKLSNNSKAFRRKSQKALGQILFYSDLFSEDYSRVNIKRKILLCGKRDPYELIDETCRRYGIEVISVTD